MRLRVRLVAGFVAVHLALSVVAGLVAWQWLDHSRRDQAEASAEAIGRVLAGGGFSPSPAVIERMRTLTGYEFRLLSQPEAVRSGTIQVSQGGAIIEIDYRTPEWHAASRQVVWATVWWSLGGTLVFAAVAMVLATQFAKPVERLARSARLIGGGDWTAPVPVTGSGEVAELAAELERMRGDLIARERRLRQNERLATLGTFTATIAHEVRNPLSAVRLTAQLLARRYPDEAGLALVGEEIERLDLTVDELLAFSRGMSVTPVPTDAWEVITAVVRLLRRQAEHAGVDLRPHDARPAPGQILVDPLRLRQLVLNLTLNAIQAVQRSPGEIAEVHLILEPTALRVADSGAGVDPAIVPQLFEAFTTSRPEGTGLGLHLAKCIADAHGADLAYTPGNPGACFTLSGLRPA